MSQNSLKKALAGLKDYEVPMGVTWLKDNRASLLATISSEYQPVSIWQGMALFFSNQTKRLSFSLGVSAAVLASLVGIVHASQDSLPGDRLYATKRSWERVKYNFALRDVSRVEMDLKLAQLRVQELSLVVKRYNSSTDNAILNEAVNDFHRGLSTVKYRLDNAQFDDAKKATEIAKIIDKNTDAYAQTLKEVSNDIDNGNNTKLKDEFSKKVNLALINVEQTGIQAVSVIVQKQVDSKSPVDDDVKSRIAKKIQTTEAALENSKVKVEKIEKKIQADKVSLTPVVEGSPDKEKLKKTIDQAKMLVEERSKGVLDDAKKSLDEGDLVDAVIKLTQIRQLSDDVNDKIEKAENSGVTTTPTPAPPVITPSPVKPQSQVPAGKVGLTPVE